MKTATAFRYTIDGLDCANCANKIEGAVAKMPFVESAFVNFSAGTLKYTLTEEAPEDSFERINKTVSKVEDGAKLVPFKPAVRKPIADTCSGADHDHVHGHTHEHTHSHEHEHTHNHTAVSSVPVKKSFGSTFFTPTLLLILTSLLLLVLGVALPLPTALKYLFLGASVLISGYKTVLGGLKNLFRFQFEETVLMTIATVAAFLIGEPFEGAMVMLLFSIGQYLEELAVGKSRKDIKNLTNIRPDTANILLDDGTIAEMAAEDVSISQKIILRAGDRVALDCRVIEGNSSVDSAAITGESLPVSVSPGDIILSGSINQSALLTAEVTSTFENSAASRIIELVENSVEKKGRTETLITKFSRIYTPIVIVAAALVALIPMLFQSVPLAVAIKPALVFLVASCPCAFVIAVPLGFYSAIGSVSKLGVLVKGGKYIESLSSTKAAVFDKTGTLTTGKLAVDEVLSLDESFQKETILELAAMLESSSSHPIATSIIEHYGKDPSTSRVKYLEELPGHGLKADVDGKTILVGGKRLMERFDISTAKLRTSNIYVAVENKLVGQIFISDQIKPTTVEAIANLREEGISRIVMLSGDNEEIASHIASLCGIDEYHGNQLPEDKAKNLEVIQKESGNTLFVGDGINDAPVIKLADTGVAMGLGSDLAIESADVVLMSGDIANLANSISLSKKALRTIWGLILFSIGVKLSVLIAAAFFGFTNMTVAVFSDVGVSLIAVLVASRIMQFHKKYTSKAS